jgi:hypothetical protein
MPMLSSPNLLLSPDDRNRSTQFDGIQNVRGWSERALLFQYHSGHCCIIEGAESAAVKTKLYLSKPGRVKIQFMKMRLAIICFGIVGGS